MGNLTIVLDEEVERRLRMRAAQLYGTRKGALSASIQKAIEDWLKTPQLHQEAEARLFRAYKNRRVIAEAKSLRELAARLRQGGIDPRSVEIRSSEQVNETAHLGMRAKTP